MASAGLGYHLIKLQRLEAERTAGDRRTLCIEQQVWETLTDAERGLVARRYEVCRTTPGDEHL